MNGYLRGVRRYSGGVSAWLDAVVLVIRLGGCMTTVTFDTLRFVERLEKAGLPREQATAIVEAQ